MLPPGVHYIYYSPVGKEKNVAPRRGFFIHISTGQLIVHRFDVQHEEILDDVPEEEVGRFKSNLKNIDGQLGAYPFNLWSKWVSLTNRINCDSLEKYQVTQTPGSLDAQLKFTEVSKRKYPEGASAAEISLHNLDSSYQLETFLKNHTSIDGVLTELQLAFTLFLIGQDYESFNHWKLVVDMMCGCGKALIKYPNLFKNFIKDLHFQVLIVDLLIRHKDSSEHFSYEKFPRISSLTLFHQTTFSWQLSPICLKTFVNMKPTKN